MLINVYPLLKGKNSRKVSNGKWIGLNKCIDPIENSIETLVAKTVFEAAKR